MKPKNNSLLSILSSVLVIVLAFTSCKRDALESITEPQTGPYASLQDFYSQNAVEEQAFVINPAQDIIITGSQGTRVNIFANTLVDSAGMPPAGSVTMNLKEIYSVKDMLLSHVLTTSNGNILQSGGMFYLDFSSNGIHYGANSTIIVSMPASNIITGMKVFYGVHDSNEMNWVLADSSVNYVVPDTLYYNLYLDSLGYGWINCDQLYNQTPVTNVSITPIVNPERNETVDLEVFLVFPLLNSCMQVYNSTTPPTVVANNIPVGMPAVAVAVGIGRITRKVYFGFTSFVVASQPVNVSLMQLSDAQIASILQNL